MKLYQATHRLTMLWRICMIAIILLLYAVPATAEANGIIMRSPDIGEEVTNEFIFAGLPQGQVSYTLTDPNNVILAQGIVQNDDPSQLIITLENQPEYTSGTYTFAFEISTGQPASFKNNFSKFDKLKKVLQTSGGAGFKHQIFKFGITQKQNGCPRSW